MVSQEESFDLRNPEKKNNEGQSIYQEFPDKIIKVWKAVVQNEKLTICNKINDSKKMGIQPSGRTVRYSSP